MRLCSSLCASVSRFLCHWKQAVSSVLFIWSSSWCAGWSEHHHTFILFILWWIFYLCPDKVLIKSPSILKKILHSTNLDFIFLLVTHIVFLANFIKLLFLRIVNLKKSQIFHSKYSKASVYWQWYKFNYILPHHVLFQT